MESSDDRKRCPICLDTIARESEAFLDHCFHKFCYHCILQWSEMAVAHLSGPVQSLECPLCKNHYVSIIHNLHGKRFQRHYIIPSRGRSTGFFMSQAHLRRQAVYSVQQGYEGHVTIQSTEAGLVQNRFPTTQFSADSISRAGRNRWLQCWVQRELEALMEEEDVQIVLHHVMGVIDFYGSRSKKGTHEVNKNETIQKDWRKALATAVQPFLFENALKFVEELEKFLVSGLDIAAFDDLGKSEHVVEENRMVLDSSRDLKDVERGENIQEDGEWVGNQIDHSEIETGDLKRDRTEGQLMYPSVRPTTSVHGLDSCRDGNCSDGVFGRGLQSRRMAKKHSTRKMGESDTTSPVLRHKNKEKHRHQHRSTERERGRSPHSRKKKKSNSFSPPRQARTRDKAMSKETKKTTEYRDMSQEQVRRKRRRTEAIPSKAHSRRSRSGGASKRARNKEALLGDNAQTGRYKERKGRRRGTEPEEPCTNASSSSSGEEDKSFTSLVETNKPDLALCRKKGNSRDNQVLTFDSLDAEKLDDATLEAEIQEMKLRQQALSNLMKHLEDSRRRRMEAATHVIVASGDAGAPSSHSGPEFDRYSPEKGGGYDLPSFCRESAGGWAKSSEERPDDYRTGSDSAYGTHGPIEVEHASCTLTSNMPNVLQERGYRTIYDVRSPILDHPAAKPESGKDAPAHDGTQKLKLPLRLESSGQSAGKCGKGLKPECRVVSSTGADVNGVTGGTAPSFKIPATQDRLDQSNRHTNSAPGNVEKASNKDNLRGSKRREEEVVAVATSTSHERQPHHPSSATGPDSHSHQSSNQQGRIKIRRESDSYAPSHSKVVGGSDHQIHLVVMPHAPALENCNEVVAAVIHCDESVKMHTSLVSERVGCEDEDTVCRDGQEAILVLSNGEESVGHSNTIQTRQEDTGGQGVNTLSVVNEVGASSAVDVVGPCAAQSAGGHEDDGPLRVELLSSSPVDGNSMGLSSVSDQDAKPCDAGEHPSKQAVSSAAFATLQHLGSDASDQVAAALLADGGQSTDAAPSTSSLKSDSLIMSNKDATGALPAGFRQEIVDSAKLHLPNIGSDKFKQKTMSVMRGGESVEVSYKVYIPPQAAARAARRKLQR